MPSSGGVIAYLRGNEKGRLEKLAEKQDRSCSYVARKAILEYLEREEKKSKK